MAPTIHEGAKGFPSERTALLSNDNGNGSWNDEDSTQSGSESGSDIPPDEFDNLLCQSESYTSGLGIEPASQENSMLRGPRKYSSIKNRSRRASEASTASRRITTGSIAGSENAIIEEDEDEQPKSPFLAGVSVARFWFIFSGILIAYFISCFDSTIMVSSHPIITSYFHSSNSASWLSTAFLLTSTSFQPVFGRLSDTIGRKRPYVFCMSVFFGATVWCGAAQSMLSFILARALCGLGAGGMMTMGTIITSDLVPIEIRGIYQSYINILYGLGSALGAAVGGAIADSLGWRWEFYIQLPAIGLCLLIACFTVPPDLGLKPNTARNSLWQAMKVFDIKGSILLTTSTTFLILGFNLGGNILAWTHPFIISSLAITTICIPLFIITERSVPLPIMPLSLLTTQPLLSLIFSNTLGTMISNSIIFNIPLFFQAVMLESATQSGLRLIFPSLAASTIGTLTGFIITWNKNLKMPIVVGTAFFLGGCVGLSLMTREMRDWIHVILLLPVSMGQGFLFPATSIAVLAVSEQSEQAVVTSTLVLWRSLGTVLGVAISSLVVQNALRVFLGRWVEGSEKDEIIERVRESVKAIAELKQPYRDQVIAAYSASLRATFIMATVLSIICVLVVAPLRLPRLGHRK